MASAELKAFLDAEDLDELLTARQSLNALNEEDIQTVRSVLQQWSNPQAVANLLFHPPLIPPDLRLASLLRGLAERQVVYFVLAAVVGLQSISSEELTELQRRRMIDDLLSLISMTEGVLACRASVSGAHFLNGGDVPRVFALLNHNEKTVRHNLLAWLIRTFEGKGVEAFAAAARACKLPDEVRQSAVERFSDYLSKRPEGLASLIFPLYAYIPNLRDVQGAS